MDVVIKVKNIDDYKAGRIVALLDLEGVDWEIGVKESDKNAEQEDM